MFTILLIDDDSMEFHLVQHMLKECLDEKFVLRYANTIPKAKAVLKMESVDVVLLDDKLNNGLTAEQTVPVLREATENVPLVVISSVIDAAYLKDKTILNVFDVVDKFPLQKKIQDGLFTAL